MGHGSFFDDNAREDAAADRRGAAAEGDLGLRIGRDGTWYDRGSPIRRPALVKLFASVLRRDDSSGEYWMVTPVERGRVAVDDAPFVAVELRTEGAGRGARLDLRTNLDVWVPVGPDHPLTVRDGGGGDAAGVPYLGLERGLEARLARPVYYELVELAVPGPDEAGELDRRRVGVWSRGRFFPLGELEG